MTGSEAFHWVIGATFAVVMTVAGFPPLAVLVGGIFGPVTTWAIFRRRR